MKAAFFDVHGDLDVLQVGELPTPEPGPDEVRVRVEACALNRLDLFVRQGWPGLRLEMPHVGGTDLAGVIDAVGSGVDAARIGQEVIVNPGLNFEADADGEQVIPAEPKIIGENASGGLATHCIVPATHALAKPEGTSWEEAACLPLTLQTAFQMLRRAGIAPRAADRARDSQQPGAGKRVLVVGGGGGVSVMLIQLAKALGAWVVATTGGSKKVSKVEGLGADLVIDYATDEAWAKTAFLATDKQGFDAVFDSVGQATWAQSLRSLRAGGRLVTCGATTGPVGETNIQLVFWKQLQVIGSTMGTPEDLERALSFVSSGHVRPIVDSVWSLDQAKEAQAHMASGTHFGKIIVRP